MNSNIYRFITPTSLLSNISGRFITIITSNIIRNKVNLELLLLLIIIIIILIVVVLMSLLMLIIVIIIIIIILVYK